jgi:iron complex transport system substrate-binding protein
LRSFPRPALKSSLLALLVLAATALAACGSSDPGPSEDQGGTRTVTDARGTEVRVPAQPRRVVTLSEPTLDSAIALGLRPVATTNGRGDFPSYLAAQTHGVPTVGLLGRPDVEHVAALQPDLILLDATAGQDAAVTEELRDIAPTVDVSKTGQDWRTAFAATAAVLNRVPEGAHLLAELDERVAEVRDGLGKNADAVVSVVHWDRTSPPSALLKGSVAGRVLEDLGLRRPPAQDRQGPGRPVPVNLTNLRQIDGDWLFLAASREALRAARATPGFTRLRAVRDGHIVRGDGSAWTSAGGPLAERVIVNDVARALDTAP